MPPLFSGAPNSATRDWMAGRNAGQVTAQSMRWPMGRLCNLFWRREPEAPEVALPCKLVALGLVALPLILSSLPMPAP